MNSIQKLTKSIGLFLLLTLTFHSCSDDDNTSTTPQNQDPNPTAFAQNFFGNQITRNFLGTVVDHNNNPLENVNIRIGNNTAMTDANGIFIINSATVYRRFGYIIAEKAGYIHASRAVVPTSGTNKVRIMMLPETVVGTTSSGTQETISLQNGASVALDGNYIKPDGSAYSGNVNVIMHHLDPTDENMEDQMPGMLYAATAQNEERMLQTFGMLAVELRGSNGEDLNLAEGSTAQISVPLDPSLIADAPSSIPLWYFDETNGYWIEEGQATLVGNNYVGTVSHFSFWNCDIPAEAVNLCITVLDESGNNLSGLLATIESSIYGSRSGYTNEDGVVCGLVPSNENLVLDLFNALEGQDLCGESIYNSTIGPFSSDSSIEVTVNNIGGVWITETIVGNFEDCGGDPVSEGYVRLFSDSNFSLDIDFVENGDFELSTLRCSSSSDIFRLHAVDYVNIQETDTISFTYTTPITDIGTIASCNDVDEFITYQVDGGSTVTEYFGINCGFDGQSYFSVSFYNDATAENSFFSIGIGNEGGTPITVGTYPPSPNNYLAFQDSENGTNPNGSQSNITINISAIGEIGEHIDFTFSGTYTDLQTNIEHTISGTIHALRDY